MRFFKRKKKQNNNVQIDDKVIRAMNFTPYDYVHSTTYEKLLFNPLADARKEINKIPVSALVDDEDVICNIRDSKIDADVNAECVYGSQQFIYHIEAIKKIFESINESIPAAESLKKNLGDDLKKIEADIEKYEKMSNQSIHESGKE